MLKLGHGDWVSTANRKVSGIEFRPLRSHVTKISLALIDKCDAIYDRQLPGANRERDLVKGKGLLMKILMT